TARPSRRGGFSRPGEILFGEVARRTSGGAFIPTPSTVASPARLLDSYFEALLLSMECYRGRDYPAKRILCHWGTRSRTALNFSPLPLAQSSNTAQLLPATQARGRCCRASADWCGQARMPREARHESPPGGRTRTSAASHSSASAPVRPPYGPDQA